ncbi:MAG: DUF1217 domain-containing protein [Hyphomicrobium sp.]
MTSTYISFRVLANDLDRTLSRQAARSDIAREAQYYRDNISSASTVDDFLADPRLYNYAMKANGLEDMIYAKAFMRKVLESDRTDTNSFVNKLADTRFLNFAKSFNFSPDGKLAAVSPSMQDQLQLDDTLESYSVESTNRGSAAATESEYFKTAIATIANVDQFVSDNRLFDFALKAVGIDPSIASKAAIKSVLTSDLNDPESYANSFSNSNYAKLAKAISFAADGSASSGAQTTLQTANTVFNYFERTNNGGTPAAATARAAYFQQAIGQVNSVDDLVNDETLLNVVANGFGLDASIETAERIRNVLISDLSDPGSYVYQLSNPAYQEITKAFNFEFDGSLASGTPAMKADAQVQMIADYKVNYDDAAIRRATFAKNIFTLGSKGVTSVDDLMRNSTLYNVTLDAFGFDHSTSKATIRRALVADENDPSSFVNTTRDARFKSLASAFNFGDDGQLIVPPRAQLESAKQATMRLYSTTVDDPTETQQATKDANVYYNQAMDGVGSVDEFLSDKKLVSYVTNAYGFSDGDISNDTFRSILTSDPLDRSSFVNTGDNKKYRLIASAFNFRSDGTAGFGAPGKTQDYSKVVSTVDAYVRQSMETDAGDSNEAVRLALYFQRKAPTVTTALEILADKAVFQVVRTALNLPDSMVNLDIDVQAALIGKKLDVSKFDDSKYVDTLISRFSAMYDIKNSTAELPSVALTILQQIGR